MDTIKTILSVIFISTSFVLAAAFLVSIGTFIFSGTMIEITGGTLLAFLLSSSIVYSINRKKLYI